MVAAAENPDTSISVVVFNEGKTEKSYTLELGEYKKIISIEAQAIQTVVIN